MSKLREWPIAKLSPTQLTVGMIEVREKQQHLASLKPTEQDALMADHPIPAVAGPQGRLYITDHHHLARAALEAGVASGYCDIEADLSALGSKDFWNAMNDKCWVHPLDEHGVRHVYSSIPAGLDALVDDVYRSLAGYVRHAGGYDKTPTAFAEFVWADFFRRSLPIELVRADFQATVKAALPLARSHMAKDLPGYRK